MSMKLSLPTRPPIFTASCAQAAVADRTIKARAKRGRIRCMGESSAARLLGSSRAACRVASFPSEEACFLFFHDDDADRRRHLDAADAAAVADVAVAAAEVGDL